MNSSQQRTMVILATGKARVLNRDFVISLLLSESWNVLNKQSIPNLLLRIYNPSYLSENAGRIKDLRFRSATLRTGAVGVSQSKTSTDNLIHFRFQYNYHSRQKWCQTRMFPSGLEKQPGANAHFCGAMVNCWGYSHIIQS